MINKFFRLLGSTFVIILIIGLLIVNIKIHYVPPTKTINSRVINCDLLKELRGLKHSIQNNADVEMQKIYPEGYVFLNALYGLAWCNFIENSGRKYFNEGHVEIQNTWNRVNSDFGRSTFDPDLPLAYGAFYTGWSTYLLGKKLGIERRVDRNTNEVSQFKNQCEQIASSIEKNIFPTSYSHSAWPGDIVLGVAALSLHDKLFQEKYASSIQAWLGKVKTKLDPHGLIPHAVNSLNFSSKENARGSSQSLMLIFLKDIDETFARSQFKIYKEKFLDRKLGLPGIREFPIGEFGIGDVDSGPVIFQIGAASTIVGMQTLNLFGNDKESSEIRNAIEAFGFPWQNDEQKTYLWGVLPMADAFIAWGHSSMIMKDEKIEFTAFHIYSSLLLVIFTALLWYSMRPWFTK